MSKPINNLALGLLSLFDIKSMGSYPKELGEAISPVFDVGKLTAYTNAQNIVGAEIRVANQASGTFALTTPILMSSNEYWLVTNYSTYVVTNAVAGIITGGFRLGHTDESRYGFCQFPSTQRLGGWSTGGVEDSFASYAANSRTFPLESYQEPFLIPPRSGGQILINFPSNTVVPGGGIIDFCFSFRMIRLRI